MRRIIIALMILLMPCLAEAKSLYVAANGNDSITYANNTLDAPWRTVSKALMSAQAGDTVYFRAGTYTISSKISVSTSGTIASPITITSYQSEPVTWQTSPSLRDPAIAMDGVSYWTFSYLTVHYAYSGTLTDPYGDRGFWRVGFDSACTHITWDHIAGTSNATGDNFGIIHIKAGCHYATVRNSTFQFPTGGHVSTAGVIIFTSDYFTVENNHFINGGSSFYNKHSNSTCTHNKFRYNYIEQNYAGHYGYFSNSNAVDMQHNIIYAPTATAGAVTIGDANGGKPNPLQDNLWRHNTIIGKFYTKYDLGGCLYNSLNYNIITGNLLQNDGMMDPRMTSYTYNLIGGSVSPSISGNGNIIGPTPTFVGTGGYGKQASIGNYALRSDSYGYQACPDGTDMGADVTKVGPEGSPSDTPEGSPSDTAEGSPSDTAGGGISSPSGLTIIKQQ